VISNLLSLVDRWPTSKALAGLPAGAAAWAIAQRLSHPTLVVVPTPAEATRMAIELRFHLHGGAPVSVMPPDDVRPYDGLSPHPDIIRQRLVAIMQLQAGGPGVVVTSARGVLHQVLDSDSMQELTSVLKAGDVIDRDTMVQGWVQHGYHSVARVEEQGTVSTRGAVIDLWPTGAKQPVRIELFDDEVEEIRTLDPDSQRSIAPISSVSIPPAREAVPTESALSRLSTHTQEMIDELGGGQTTRRSALQDLRQGLWFPGAEDYLGAMWSLIPLWKLSEHVITIDPEEVSGRLTSFAGSVADRWSSRSMVDRPPVRPTNRYTPIDDAREALNAGQSIQKLAIEDPTGLEPCDYQAQSNVSLYVGKGDLAPTIGRLHQWLEDGWRVALVIDSQTRAERLRALLSPHGLLAQPEPTGEFSGPGRLSLWIGALPRGFHCPTAATAIVTADEIFGSKRRSHTPRKTLKEATLGSVNELKVGDLVVHVRHGVGRFERLKRIDLDGRLQEFAEVQYRGGDRLYLPVTRLDELYRFRAVGESNPKLDKLGGESWEKRKAKVRDRVLRMAHHLLDLHAQRATIEAIPYPGEPAEFHQFCETFPFVETPDQAAAIEEVLSDLATPTPMDRLVVGDVGFGKTEVSMRAAMRVVLGGHQVTVLCPTTILAFQHLESFRKRFDGTPVRIEMLSAFRSAQERMAVLKDTAEGKVDVLIGTTSLLTRDLRFRHLGLVVVDEEHRFGVRQKHKLKQLTSTQPTGPVHYLAMSATPIPRTLHMALSGLRKVSLITTPPPDRRAVQTHVTRFDEERIREDVLAELGRGGQVFFVHNRVASIEAMTARLRTLIPEANIAIGHGQMDKKQLEKVLVGFIQRKHHMLVCSTIIESGVDIPSVNTMIVNRADELGMAQLYQLRGRVGRSHIQARCTLMIPKDKPLTQTAMLRLRALQEHSDLGSGFAIATRDMEVRGSGTLLGEAQHGHIQAVGFDTYVELLEEAIANARGDLSRKRLDPEIEVPVPMLLPESWIPDLEDRLSAYRALAMARTTEAVRSILGDWEDRYGEPPEEVLNLGWAAEAKVRARLLGVANIRWKKIRVDLDFDPSSTVSRERIVELVSRNGQRFSLAPIPGSDNPEGGRLVVRFTPEEGRWPFRFLHWVFRQFESDEQEGAEASYSSR
jgi:transcription-repair coupling factor (superfamily II helicase)